MRLIALNADPPPWLSWSTGPYTDEGFYTLDARHEALFGTWAPGNFHDRLLSPLLSLLQQAAFTLVGPSLLSARLLSVAFSLLTLFVFHLGLRRAWGTTVANSGALFLGLAPPFVFYNRLALQETPTVFWLVLAFTLWSYGAACEVSRKRAWLLILSGAAVAIAVVFKSLVVIALPAFAWAWWRGTPSRPGKPGHPPPSALATRRAERESEGSVLARGRGPLGFGVVLAVYAILWLAPHHAELARMATYYRVHQMQPHSWGNVGLNLRRGLIGGERGVVPYLLALMPVPCLLAVWGTCRPAPPPGAVAPGSGAGGAARRLVVLWLLGGLVFCLLSSYAPSRYYVLFLPPLAALAALGMRALRPSWPTVAVGIFLVTSALWYADAWTHRTDARQEAAQGLARSLPSRSVMVGEFAPSLCLDTQIAAAPVQPGLSNDLDPVERLHADAVAVTRAPVWQRWWQSRYPNIVQPSHRLITVTVGGSRHYVVDVYLVRAAKP